MNPISYLDFRVSLFSGKNSCQEEVKKILAKEEKIKSLNIFIETFDATAIARAIEVDNRVKNKTAGKLAGLIIAIKDNICYKGHKTTASSKILEGFESIYNASVIERLLDEDAIIIGRVGCDEFAMGSSNETSYYGPIKNPIDSSKVPGGSSGGSAAAVRAGLCHVALGSDTGGSVRQPASFCGVIGYKPSYGLVSRYGLIAFTSSFDQIGPIANTIEDINLVMEVITGEDGKDDTLSDHKVDFLLATKKKNNFKIAYFKEFLSHKGINSEIKTDFYDKLKNLKKLGYQIEEIEFPYVKQIIPVYYVLSSAEASSNLARYDGVHFGYRAPDSESLEDLYIKTRSEGFGEEVKKRILLGTYVLSAGYYDSYYGKAQKVRRKIKEYTSEIFSKYDFILSPTSPNFPFDLGIERSNPLELYLQDIYTVLANISGLPAISLPLYHSKETGLPSGFQVFSEQYNDDKLLSFSSFLMSHKWH